MQPVAQQSLSATRSYADTLLPIAIAERHASAQTSFHVPSLIMAMGLAQTQKKRFPLTQQTRPSPPPLLCAQVRTLAVPPAQLCLLSLALGTISVHLLASWFFTFSLRAMNGEWWHVLVTEQCLKWMCVSSGSALYSLPQPQQQQLYLTHSLSIYIISSHYTTLFSSN